MKRVEVGALEIGCIFAHFDCIEPVRHRVELQGTGELPLGRLGLLGRAGLWEGSDWRRGERESEERGMLGGRMKWEGGLEAGTEGERGWEGGMKVEGREDGKEEQREREDGRVGGRDEG